MMRMITDTDYSGVRTSLTPQKTTRLRNTNMIAEYKTIENVTYDAMFILRQLFTWNETNQTWETNYGIPTSINHKLSKPDNWMDVAVEVFDVMQQNYVYMEECGFDNKTNSLIINGIKSLN